MSPIDYQTNPLYSATTEVVRCLTRMGFLRQAKRGLNGNFNRQKLMLSPSSLSAIVQVGWGTKLITVISRANQIVVKDLSSIPPPYQHRFLIPYHTLVSSATLHYHVPIPAISNSMWNGSNQNLHSIMFSIMDPSGKGLDPKLMEYPRIF